MNLNIDCASFSLKICFLVSWLRIPFGMKSWVVRKRSKNYGNYTYSAKTAGRQKVNGRHDLVFPLEQAELFKAPTV